MKGSGNQDNANSLNFSRPIEMDTKLSVYQKEIQETDNPILCVAKAERMVFELGKALIAGAEMNQESDSTKTHEVTDSKWFINAEGPEPTQND
jgi:hypothetical protein